MENDKKQIEMNRNVKLAPSYIAITWDVIFVWTISTMFFSTQKGLSYSEIIALDSILMFIGCVISIPLTKLFQKVKPLTAIRIGTLGYGMYLLLCIFGSSFWVFALAQFFIAFAYIVCGIKVNTWLNKSLTVINKNGDYQKIFGRGLSLYFILEAIGAVIISYIYNWNPYAAYWVSFGIVVIAELFSLLLKEPTKYQERNVKTLSNKTQKQKSNSVFKILSSGFFVALLIFMFFMRGVLSIVSSGFKVYLQQQIEIGNLPVQAFGYIYAFYRLFSALASKYQFKFDLKFGVKSLILLTSATIISFLSAGLIYMINSTSLWSMVLIIAFSYVQGMIFTPCRIFVNNYMQVCIQQEDIEKAYSIRAAVEYLGYAIISAIYAALLNGFGNNYGLTTLTYISIFAVPIIVCVTIFIRVLIKNYASKKTIIIDEYTKD